MINLPNNAGEPWDELKRYQVAVRRYVKLMSEGRVLVVGPDEDVKRVYQALIDLDVAQGGDKKKWGAEKILSSMAEKVNVSSN